MSKLFLDIRQALRSLLGTPGFTVPAALTLALGIGANTAIFTVVQAVILRPLPFEAPDRLMALRENKLPELPEFSVSAGNFLAWREQNTTLDQLAAFATPRRTLTGQGDPEALRSALITTNYFRTLGVQPILGRSFVAGEGEPEHDAVVILSHGLWQRRLGGSPGVLNSTLTLNGRPHVVVGIMPRGFGYPRPDVELWIPLTFPAGAHLAHGNHNMSAIARLKPGVSLAQAQADLSAIAHRLAQSFPDSNTGWDVHVVPMHEDMIKGIRATLLVLMGAVVLVLLIACANTANLLLARASARSKEISIRTALGASRWSVVRMMLTESLVLTALGAILGVFLAWVSLKVLLSLVPLGIPRLQDVHIDATVLAFAVGTTLFTCLLFGLFPALQASHPCLTRTLNEEGRGSSGGRETHRMRGVLVVAEVALSLVLLVSANLLMTSFLRMRSVNPGFDPRNTLVLSLALPEFKYPEDRQQLRFSDDLLQRLQELPGLRHSAVASPLPFLGDRVEAFGIGGRLLQQRSAWPLANFYAVSPDYFQAMGIPLQKGRAFGSQDRETSARVVIINQSLAQRFFPREDPLGKTIHLDDGPEPPGFEIVGVVGDTKQYGLATPNPLQAYQPFAQAPGSLMTLVLRSQGDPMSLAGALRRELTALDEDLPIQQLQTLEQVLSGSLTSQRFATSLLATFSVVALLLANLGIYSVVSYLVSQRRREFGIRMALGAQGRQVVWEVTRQSLVLTALGTGVGVIATLATGRLLANQLFGVQPADPLAMAQSALILGLVALLAAFIPASRAARVAPSVVLRNE